VPDPASNVDSAVLTIGNNTVAAGAIASIDHQSRGLGALLFIGHAGKFLMLSSVERRSFCNDIAGHL